MRQSALEQIKVYIWLNAKHNLRYLVPEAIANKGRGPLGQLR